MCKNAEDELSLEPSIDAQPASAEAWGTLRAVWCGDIYASVAAREVKVTAADKMHALY